MRKIQVYEAYRSIISFIAPNCCPFCGKVIGSREYFCGDCPGYLYEVKGDFPPPENLSRLFACCYYIGRARKAVHRMKYGRMIYPVNAFAVMMSEKIGKSAEDYDVIVPVPSSNTTIMQRGFNPVRLIAQQISMRTGLPVVKAVRAYDSKREQKQLSPKMRRINAAESFYCTEDLSGRRVLLVDDVMTTGSTVSEIGGMLRRAGAENVAAAVFAKGVDADCASLLPNRYVIRK